MARTLNDMGLLTPPTNYDGTVLKEPDRNKALGLLADVGKFTLPEFVSGLPSLADDLSYNMPTTTKYGNIPVPDSRYLELADVIPIAGIANKTAKVLSKPSLLSKDQYIDRMYRNFPEFKESYKRIDKDVAPETSMNGRVLNTDVARELFPEYVENRTRSSDVHEGASTFIKELYADKLRNPTPEGLDPVVTFTAGGTGSGKTTGLKMFGNDKSEMIYDTNMANFNSAKNKIDDALDSGREVDIIYVYRDPVEALRNGSLSRAKNQTTKYGTGRTVPLKEHLKTHTGSRDVIEKIGKEYVNNPKVNISLIDNSKINPEPTTFDKLPKISENKVSKELKKALDDMYKNNVITKEIYESSK